MVFSSIEFLLGFLPAFLLLYWITPRAAKNVVLLAGSLIFYAYGEPRYLLLLMVSVMLNYFFGLHIGIGRGKRGGHKKARLNRKRRFIFWMAVTFNISVLVLFKQGLADGRLPLGISFYTFQILSYLADVYMGEEERETSFVRMATYIMMFPQLVSGPIVRYGEVRESMHHREFTIAGVQDGLKVFTAGLALKVLLADRIGILWREVQVTGFESISTPLAWLAAIAYSMQLYFDFYGYSLMGIGLGKMLGFELPENFKNPYMATSVRDFYRRWHMTLGRWFSRYIYIPLGGNRRGEFRTLCNLLAVWFLTARWHGSTANFFIWGMLLWLCIVLERQFSKLKISKLFEKKVLRIVPHFYLLFMIIISWMCFAIADISELEVYLGRMFGTVEAVRTAADDWLKALRNYGYLFVVGGLACTPALQKLFRKGKDSFFGTVVLVALFWVCIWRLQVEGQNPFMYFSF